MLSILTCLIAALKSPKERYVCNTWHRAVAHRCACMGLDFAYVMGALRA